MKRESVVVLAAVVFLLPLHFLSRSQALFKPVESDKVVGGSEVGCDKVIEYWSCTESNCDWKYQDECFGNCQKCSNTSATLDVAYDASPRDANWAVVDMQSVVTLGGACGIMSSGSDECIWQNETCMCPADMFDENVPCSADYITIFNTDCIPSNPPPPEPWPF